MAHKHNRRRVRPRHRYSLIRPLSSSPDGLPESLDNYPSSPLGRRSSRSGSPQCSSMTPRSQQAYSKLTDLAARHWENRYLAWQKRDKIQKDEAVNAEAEQCRLFGGEPGDDITLCYKMLEYFDAMDYIDT